MSKPKLTDIFGEDVLKTCSLDKTPNKKISIADLMGKSSKTDYDNYLNQRWGSLLDNADPTFKKNTAKTLMSIAGSLGIELSLDDIDKERITGMIRAKETDINIMDMFDLILLQNSILEEKTTKKIDIGIPIHDLTFNTMVEGKYKQNHIAFDTEADSEGKTTFNSTVNWESKRIVVACLSDEWKIETYKTNDDWWLIYLYTPNLWEGTILADYESLIAANLLSALEQGSIETKSLYKKCFLQELIHIDIEKLAKTLNNEAKSIWLCHNNRYDINQLNNNYKFKRGKRQKFNIVKTKPAEFLQIRHNREDLYKVKMGNSVVGFRFNATCNTRFSFFGIPQLTLAPSQTQSYSLITGVDTLNLAFAGQFPKKTLLALSKGLEYEKMDLDETKIFTKEDMKIVDGKITEKLKYNLLDCFATLSVYKMLSYHFHLLKVGELLNIDLSITKDWNRPFVSSILSPASIAKFVFFQFFQKHTGLSKKQIENNFELTRKYLVNFTRTYFGGRTEGYVFGLIESTELMKIKYPDFEAQYPNAARLIQAVKMMLLTSQDKLINLLDYDTKDIEEDFWKTLEYTVQTKLKNKPIKDSFAEKILGNVSITHSVDLTFRLKINKRLQERKLMGDKGNKITLTLLDLLTVCERKILLDKYPIKKLRSKIKFIQAERLLMGDTPEFGDELFTKLLLFRRTFKEELETEESQEEPIAWKIQQLVASEQNLKYIMNSGYGVTAEGISKDFIGKLQNPAVATLITAMARYLSVSAEILYIMNGGTPIYSDTDSLPALATEETHQLVFDYFSNTIPFKEETKFGEITQFYVLGKKKYGILNTKGEVNVKIHGTAGYRDTKEAYTLMYKLLMEGKLKTDQIAKEVVKIHPINQQLSFKKKTEGRVKKILEILANGKMLRSYTVFTNGEPIKLYVYSFEKNFLIINTQDYRKGQFGAYLNVERNSSSNLIIHIATAGDFREILDQIVDIEQNSEIFTQIKHAKQSRERISKMYSALTLITDNLQVQTQIDEYTDQIMVFEEGFDDWQQDYPTFHSIFNFNNLKYSKALGRALGRTFEQLAHQSFHEEDEINWLHIFEGLREDKVDTETFLETFSRNVDRILPKKLMVKDQLLKEHQIHIFYGYENPIQSKVYVKIHEKTKLVDKFIKLMNFDAGRFSRKRKIVGNKPYDIMLPKQFRKVVEQDLVKQYINTDEFTCDGFDYTYYGKLPTMDFTGQLKSNEGFYYSQAIMNLSYAASQIYYETHIKEGLKRRTKIEEMMNISMEKLPCPKKDVFIYIPLRFIKKLDPKVRTIPEEDIFLVLDTPTISKLTNIGVLTKDNGTYTVARPALFRKTLKKQYVNEWIEKEWMGSTWSISIEKRGSLDYNANLSVKVVVGKEKLFRANLRLNPSSRNLYNLDLFHTTLRKLDEHSEIGKTILLELFKSKDLAYYAQKRATHKEDIEKASKPIEILKSGYLTIAHAALAKRMPKLAHKLGTVAYALNIKTLTPTTDLIPRLHTLFRNYYHKYYEGATTESERISRMREKNVSHNRFSLGININDYFNKTTVSIYGKDYYQYLGKLQRVTASSDLKELPAKQLIKIRHIKESEATLHQLRCEITIRKWENIHTKSFYRYLEFIAKIVKKIDRDLTLKRDNSKSKDELVNMIMKEAENKLNEITEAFFLEIDLLKTTEIPEQKKWEKFDMVHASSSFY